MTIICGVQHGRRRRLNGRLRVRRREGPQRLDDGRRVITDGRDAGFMMTRVAAGPHGPEAGLAVMFPLHGHIGMNYVITDYVPKLFSKAAVGPARAIMVGVTGATMLGLTKLNVEGPGITGTLKALWRKPKE